MRALAGRPQSPSTVQPQVEEARQAAPAPAAVHSAGLDAGDSAQGGVGGAAGGGGGGGGGGGRAGGARAGGWAPRGGGAAPPGGEGNPACRKGAPRPGGGKGRLGLLPVFSFSAGVLVPAPLKCEGARGVFAPLL